MAAWVGMLKGEGLKPSYWPAVPRDSGLTELALLLALLEVRVAALRVPVLFLKARVTGVSR